MPEQSYNPILGKTLSPYEGIYFRIVRNRLEDRSKLSPYQILSQLSVSGHFDEDGAEIKPIKVLKEKPQKDIRIASQKDLIGWMLRNIKIEKVNVDNEYDSRYKDTRIKDTTIFHLKSCSSVLGLRNRRGYGNIILVGKRVLESIVDSLDRTQNINRFEGPDFEYIGFFSDSIEIYTMKDQSLIDENIAIISYIGTSHMDCGIIDSVIDNEHYLQLVKEDERVCSDYTQYHRILKLDYSSIV